VNGVLFKARYDMTILYGPISVCISSRPPIQRVGRRFPLATSSPWLLGRLYRGEDEYDGLGKDRASLASSYGRLPAPLIDESFRAFSFNL
jgi:hypothetical protein